MKKLFTLLLASLFVLVHSFASPKAVETVSYEKSEKVVLKKAEKETVCIHLEVDSKASYKREFASACEARFEALEKTEEPKVHLYTIKGWAKAQGIKSIDPQTLLKIDMMAKHYSEGRYMVSKIENLNAILGLV